MDTLKAVGRQAAKEAWSRWYNLTTSQEPCEQPEYVADAVTLAVRQAARLYCKGCGVDRALPLAPTPPETEQHPKCVECGEPENNWRHAITSSGPASIDGAHKFQPFIQSAELSAMLNPDYENDEIPAVLADRYQITRVIELEYGRLLLSKEGHQRCGNHEMAAREEHAGAVLSKLLPIIRALPSPSPGAVETPPEPKTKGDQARYAPSSASRHESDPRDGLDHHAVFALSSRSSAPDTVEVIASFVEHLRDGCQSTTEPVSKVARLIRERFGKP